MPLLFVPCSVTQSPVNILIRRLLHRSTAADQRQTPEALQAIPEATSKLYYAAVRRVAVLAFYRGSCLPVVSNAIMLQLRDVVLLAFHIDGGLAAVSGATKTYHARAVLKPAGPLH